MHHIKRNQHALKCYALENEPMYCSAWIFTTDDYLPFVSFRKFINFSKKPYENFARFKIIVLPSFFNSMLIFEVEKLQIEVHGEIANWRFKEIFTGSVVNTLACFRYAFFHSQFQRWVLMSNCSEQITLCVRARSLLLSGSEAHSASPPRPLRLPLPRSWVSQHTSPPPHLGTSPFHIST